MLRPAIDPGRGEVGGVPNLRDLGGMGTADGRTLAHGRLFRSSHLAGLAGNERRRMDLRTVVDLRGADERLATPDGGLDDTVRQVHLPVEPRALAQLRSVRDADESEIVALMNGVYRRFVQEQTATWRALLHELLSEAACPLLFHCTAGKDRTGFAAAIVLLALDVPIDVIEADFLLSNERWRGRPDATGGWVTLAKVRAEYLHTAFAAMRQGWGSVPGYLASALGMDASARALLRDRLLA